MEHTEDGVMTDEVYRNALRGFSLEQTWHNPEYYSFQVSNCPLCLSSLIAEIRKQYSMGVQKGFYEYPLVAYLAQDFSIAGVLFGGSAMWFGNILGIMEIMENHPLLYVFGT